MTDDELDVMVRSTARPVDGMTPSELDPGLLDALIAAREDRVLPVRRGGPRGGRVLWAMLASAAAVLLGFTVAAMPDSWRERDVTPAADGAVQRYVLPEPWRVDHSSAPVDVDRLDIGVQGRVWYTAGVQDGDEVAFLSWQTQRLHDEHRAEAVTLTGDEGREVTVQGRPYEIHVRRDEPLVLDGQTFGGPDEAVAAVAVWVEGDTSYLLYLQYGDEAGMVDLLAALEPVSEE